MLTGPAVSLPDRSLVEYAHSAAVPGDQRYRRAASSDALIRLDDLAAGGEPHALVLLHVSDGALQIFDPQRLAGDHGMQRHAHHPRLLAAVGVEHVELVDHRPEILLAGVALADIERDVVDLVAIGDREHLSRLDLHRIGLVVVVPVAAED